MKTTEIFEQYKKAQASKTQIRDDIDVLKQHAEQLKKELPGIAESGDVSAYISAKDDLTRSEAEIEVKTAVLNKTDHPVSKEDAVKAWNEYYASADKERRSKLKEIEDLTAKLYKAYKEITDINGEMQTVMRDCETCCGSREGFKFEIVGKDILSHVNDFYRRLTVYTSTSRNEKSSRWDQPSNYINMALINNGQASSAGTLKKSL